MNYLAMVTNWSYWLINEPKSFTKPGNMKSRGYATVINLISEIRQNFDIDIFEKILQYTWNNLEKYRRVLKD